MLQTPTILAVGFFISAMVGVLCIAGLLTAVTCARAFTPWLQAQIHGAPIPFLQIVGFVFRKSDPGTIVSCFARSRAAGLDLSPAQIETHALASGKPERVLQAIIEATELGVDLKWDAGCAIDLAGHDPVDFVRVSAETGCNIFEYAEHVPARSVNKPN